MAILWQIWPESDSYLLLFYQGVFPSEKYFNYCANDATRLTCLSEMDFGLAWSSIILIAPLQMRIFWNYQISQRIMYSN